MKSVKIFLFLLLVLWLLLSFLLSLRIENKTEYCVQCFLRRDIEEVYILGVKIYSLKKNVGFSKLAHMLKLNVNKCETHKWIEDYSNKIGLLYNICNPHRIIIFMENCDNIFTREALEKLKEKELINILRVFLCGLSDRNKYAELLKNRLVKVGFPIDLENLLKIIDSNQEVIKRLKGKYGSYIKDS